MAELAERYLCEDCKWVGSEVKVADHPFVDGEKIYGCGCCGGVDLIRACDADGCEQRASSGTPTPDGCRWTCHEHRPGLPRDRLLRNVPTFQDSSIAGD